MITWMAKMTRTTKMTRMTRMIRKTRMIRITRVTDININIKKKSSHSSSVFLSLVYYINFTHVSLILQRHYI